jgi:pilus assembly protein CpaF
MSTIHAASAIEALSRLSSLALSARSNFNHSFIRTETAAAIDFVLYCERAASGTRRVREIIPVSGYDHVQHQFITECIYRASNTNAA